MSFHDDCCDIIETHQPLCGPDGFDIRPNRVFLVTVTWSGGEVRLGVATTTEVEILPRPRVEETVDGREVVIEPVIPEHTGGSGGGIPISTIHPADSAAAEHYIRIDGPNAGTWALFQFEASRPFRYRLTARCLSRDYPRPIGT